MYMDGRREKYFYCNTELYRSITYLVNLGITSKFHIISLVKLTQNLWL